MPNEQPPLWLACDIEGRTVAEGPLRPSPITLRRAGRLHHLKIGAAHARRRVLAIADEQEVTVVALETGEVLSVHRIEPDKGYWRNQQRDPGRWPGPLATG